MIVSLKLKHWKSHESSELKFGKGTNLLIGSLGSGKTSIVDAICFALYGTFPALKSRKIRLEDVVMQRPTKFSKAEVAMEFTVGDNAFTVTRSINGGATEAFLRDKTGSLLEGPQSQRVTEAVERLLGVDYELFTRSIYSEQNKIDYFIVLGRGERKKQVDELLGIDKFERARSTAATVINRLKAFCAEKEARIRQEDAQKIASEISVLKSELASLHAEKNAATASLHDLEKKAFETASEVARLEEKEREYNELEREKARAKALAEQHRASRDKNAALLSRQVTRAELAEKPVVEKRVQEMRKALQELRRLEGQVKALREQAESSKKDLALLEDVTESKRSQEKVLETLLKKREEARKNLSSAEAEAARAAASLDSLRRQEAELSTQALKANGLKQELALLSSTENTLAATRSESKRLRELVASLNAAAEQLEAALQSLSTELASCPVCDSPLPADKKTRLVQEKTVLLAKNRAELSDAQKKLVDAEKKEAEMESQVSRAAALKQELLLAETAEEKLAALRNSIASTETLARDLAGKRLEAEAELKEVEASVDGARLLLEKASRKEQLTAKAAEAEERLAQAEDEFKTLSRTADASVLEELEKKAGELAVAHQLFAEEDAAAECEKKVAAVEEALKALSFSVEELALKRREALQAASALSRASAEVQGMQRLFEEKSKLLASREQQAAALEQAEQEARLAQKRVEEMTEFQSALIETQSLLRHELVSAVNEAMASLWPAVYPYSDYASVRLRSTEDDYLLELQTRDGAWASIEGASGGEKSCAALAMRVAFAMVLTPNLSWLVLDEPTHNLDREAVSLLCRALHEEIPKIVEQTFIITHDEALKEGASAKVYFVERDKQKGDKSIVQEVSV